MAETALRLQTLVSNFFGELFTPIMELSMTSRKRKGARAVAERIRQLRNEAGSEYALAKQLALADGPGGDPARYKGAVSGWISGTRGMTADNVAKLCDVFGVSADWLLGRTDARETGSGAAAVDLPIEVSRHIGRAIVKRVASAKEPPAWASELARLQVDGEAILEDAVAACVRGLDDAWARSEVAGQAAAIALRNWVTSEVDAARGRPSSAKLDRAKSDLERASRMAVSVRKSAFHRLTAKTPVSQISGSGSRKRRQERAERGEPLTLADLGVVVENTGEGVRFRRATPILTTRE